MRLLVFFFRRQIIYKTRFIFICLLRTVCVFYNVELWPCLNFEFYEYKCFSSSFDITARIPRVLFILNYFHFQTNSFLSSTINNSKFERHDLLSLQLISKSLPGMSIVFLFFINQHKTAHDSCAKKTH